MNIVNMHRNQVTGSEYCNPCSVCFESVFPPMMPCVLFSLCVDIPNLCSKPGDRLYTLFPTHPTYTARSMNSSQNLLAISDIIAANQLARKERWLSGLCFHVTEFKAQSPHVGVRWFTPTFES